MFTPKWKKEGKLLAKGARKFVHYKRDLLKPERVAEIESRRSDLLAAMKADDRPKADEASKQLRATCEHALPHEKPQNWLEENVEVMFVAIVIALGLRAYYLQPFRIPTGSMQPTLNGIVGTTVPEKEWPGFATRLTQHVTHGRTYVKVVMDEDRQVQIGAFRQPVIKDFQFWHFFSRSNLYFTDGPPLRLPAPASQMRQLGLDSAIEQAVRFNNGVLKAGTVLAEGMIDSGDLVLVDKVSYHFRRPDRGEVFVFDTVGIRGIHERSSEQAAGSHYIKRLCGIPGDTLSIDTPHLLIDGKIASEPGIVRVMEAEGAYSNNNGYLLASPGEIEQTRLMSGRTVRQYLNSKDQTLKLASDAPTGMREYAALGDNTGSSLDSRYWGPVKEFNLVGPALFSLWPFASGHWGLIR
jgi:signal peptidase I